MFIYIGEKNSDVYNNKVIFNINETIPFTK